MFEWNLRYSKPFFFKRAADIELSTPPDIAQTIRFFKCADILLICK